MEKEILRKAFNAGKEYWQWVQTDEPLLHKPVDFEAWYETEIMSLWKAKVSAHARKLKESK